MKMKRRNQKAKQKMVVQKKNDLSTLFSVYRD
jgi:hypothetical protein